MQLIPRYWKIVSLNSASQNETVLARVPSYKEPHLGTTAMHSALGRKCPHTQYPAKKSSQWEGNGISIEKAQCQEKVCRSSQWMTTTAEQILCSSKYFSHFQESLTDNPERLAGTCDSILKGFMQKCTKTFSWLIQINPYWIALLSGHCLPSIFGILIFKKTTWNNNLAQWAIYYW